MVYNPTKDLEVSSNEEDTTLKVSIGVSTELKMNPDRNIGCNTSLFGIVDLKPKQFVTTNEFPPEVKQILKIIPRPTTQIGCVPLSIQKNNQTQADDSVCSMCAHEEHSIIQRQNYIKADAVKNISGNYFQPTNSREDRHRIPHPGTTRHNSWLKRFQPDIKLKSPGEFQKQRNSPQFTKPEIRITSQPQPTTNNVRKPEALTVDNEAYNAICSRKRTQPTLVTSQRKIFLPPPPPSNGAREYRTTKF